MQRLDEMTPSLRVLIGKTARIVLVVLAAMIAMEMLNIDLTALTVLSGAIGVGIGFGLQKVVSNFIAGIIILMDESIKPGDTITLGETFGWIRELRARFVSVITRDGREFLYDGFFRKPHRGSSRAYLVMATGMPCRVSSSVAGLDCARPIASWTFESAATTRPPVSRKIPR